MEGETKGERKGEHFSGLNCEIILFSFSSFFDNVRIEK